MAVTTKDIARECGVSLTTVQRALHGNGRISEKTKQAILTKAKELHYEPNLTARTLTLGRSRMLGVIIPFLDNVYYAEICNSMTREAVRHGYILNILVHGDDKSLEAQMLKLLENYNVDGIVMNPINKGEELQRLLHVNGRQKFCLLALDEAEEAGVCGIGIDERAAGYESAKNVLSFGYQKIYFVAPTYYDKDGRENPGHHSRYEGVKKACAEANILPLCITGDDYPEQIAEVMKKNTGGKPAFLCSGAPFAVKVIQRLFGSGMEPGREYGMMTFDKVPEMASSSNIRLAYLDNNVDQIGKLAADMIIRMCEGQNVPERINIPFTIVNGNSL